MRTVLWLLLFVGPGAGGLRAQAAVPTRYDSLFEELMGLPKSADSAFDIAHLTLRRDAATFALDTGQLYRLGPVGGRAVAVVFVGRGKLRFNPPTKVEQEQLTRLYHAPALERDFGTLFLLFADTTAAELEHGAPLVRPTLSSASNAQGAVRQGLGYLSHRGHRYFDSHFMTALLNGERNELFYAMIGDAQGGPFLFQIDPYEVEEVSLEVGKSGPALADSRAAEVSRFHWARDYVPGRPPPQDWKERFAIHRYVVDATIAANLGFRASAKLDFDWWGDPQQWFWLGLFPDFKLDSARWEGGEPAMVTHTKDNPYLWMRRPVSVGPLPALVLYYHGDLIQADGLFLDLKTSNGWYPSTGLGYGSPVTASFDLTFHTPKKYAFASIGDRVAADTAGDVVTTRWVTKDPTMHASFNIGTFDTYDVKDPRGLPVTVFVNQEAHNQIPPAYQGRSGQIVVIPRQAHMKESVGEDVALALNFFRDAFGEPPAHRFYATEISGGHGQSFPGLIHFSWVTYQGFLLAKGEDEVFRSHEMAHQWWGLGVNPASYRDAWLSEGFAEFAGWWYAEAVVRDSTAMSRILQKSKDALMLRRRAAGPIWLGTRLIGGDVPQDYSLIVYQKGAWVLRMLRYLTLDPDSAGEQPFRLMLKDFYESFRGTQASTADFQDVVQRHMRAPMDWFFNSWVYGTGIPTYVWSQTTEQGGGKATWKLRVTQREVPDDFTMIVPVHLYFRDGRNALLRVMVKGPSTDYSAEVPEKPARVIFNEWDAVLAEVKEESWR